MEFLVSEEDNDLSGEKEKILKRCQTTIDNLYQEIEEERGYRIEAETDLKKIRQDKTNLIAQLGDIQAQLDLVMQKNDKLMKEIDYYHEQNTVLRQKNYEYKVNSQILYQENQKLISEINFPSQIEDWNLKLNEFERKFQELSDENSKLRQKVKRSKIKQLEKPQQDLNSDYYKHKAESYKSKIYQLYEYIETTESEYKKGLLESKEQYDSIKQELFTLEANYISTNEANRLELKQKVETIKQLNKELERYKKLKLEFSDLNEQLFNIRHQNKLNMERQIAIDQENQKLQKKISNLTSQLHQQKVSYEQKLSEINSSGDFNNQIQQKDKLIEQLNTDRYKLREIVQEFEIQMEQLKHKFSILWNQNNESQEYMASEITKYQIKMHEYEKENKILKQKLNESVII